MDIHGKRKMRGGWEGGKWSDGEMVKGDRIQGIEDREWDAVGKNAWGKRLGKLKLQLWTESYSGGKSSFRSLAFNWEPCESKT